MNTNKTALYLSFAVAVVMLAGCNNQKAIEQQNNQAAIAAKQQQLQEIRQNPHIPDFVKARLGANNGAPAKNP